MDVVSHRSTFRASKLAGFWPDIRTSPMERTAVGVFSVFHGVLVGGSLIGTLGILDLSRIELERVGVICLMA